VRSPETAPRVATCRGLVIGAPDLDAEAIEIDGTRLSCGIQSVPRPLFDPDAAVFARHVLVRVRAFSCNFLDRAVIRRAATHLTGGRYYVIGSEFVGDVLAVGSAVTMVGAGDRVIADNDYPGSSDRCGIPSRQASREYLVLREETVIAVPHAMPDTVAAAFGVGAQTAYAMVARADVTSASHVLVTAASSHTSLCLIRALHARGTDVVAATSSGLREDIARAVGARAVVRIGSDAEGRAGHDVLRRIAIAAGGFDCVFDPFLDANMPWAMPLVAHRARYITCGVRTGQATGAGDEYATALEAMIVRNVELIGNCLGSTADLRTAMADYAAGEYDIVIDSVFDGGAAAPFLRRTFVDRGRVGKAVFRYD
jgi:NADPH:quinone reductase-like Zn-dependent oxidoreductase